MISQAQGALCAILITALRLCILVRPTTVLGSLELTDKSIQTAIKEWILNATNASLLYGPIQLWDTTRVTSMENLLKNCTLFNEDISRWDTARVTSMVGTFSGASSFNGDLSSWNIAQVTSMKSMFSGASSFNPIGIHRV